MSTRVGESVEEKHNPLLSIVSQNRFRASRAATLAIHRIGSRMSDILDGSMDTPAKSVTWRESERTVGGIEATLVTNATLPDG
jgi:hypothetical protein